MKPLMLAAFIALLSTPALAADPVEGTWKTRPDDNGNFGYVRIQPCGQALCGTLVKAFDGAGKEIPSERIGRQIVWDMVPYGNGFYDDGKVWSPDRDKTYNSEMQLNGSSLTVKGCVLGICRDGGTWTRVK